LGAVFNETFGSGNGRYIDFIPFIHKMELANALRLRDNFWDQYVAQEKVRYNIT